MGIQIVVKSTVKSEFFNPEDGGSVPLNDGNYVPVCEASQVNCHRRNNLKSLVHFASHLHKLADLLLANIANRLQSEQQTNKQPNQTRHFGG
jgi:hypothetical protein